MNVYIDYKEPYTHTHLCDTNPILTWIDSFNDDGTSNGTAGEARRHQQVAVTPDSIAASSKGMQDKGEKAEHATLFSKQLLQDPPSRRFFHHSLRISIFLLAWQSAEAESCQLSAVGRASLTLEL